MLPREGRGVEAGVWLSANEEQSLEVLRQVEEKRLDRTLACQLLDVSPRTLKRYLRRYRERGLKALAHGNCGRKPANSYPYEVRVAVHRLMRELFFDFNMTHARELIETRFQLKIPRETFRRWCHQAEVVKHRVKRRSKPRFHRTRQSQRGLLVQFDGSHHRWFGDRECCLIAAIDDATGTVLGAEFWPGESTEGCLSVLRNVVVRYGVFKVLYVDRAGIYGGIKRRGFSQVVRALGELETKVIYAQSPEGKGRVERLFRTLQDRLIPELRINKIMSIELANRYLNEIYIPQHNRHFSVEPSDQQTAFEAVPESCDLKNVFCILHQRTVARDHTISLHGDKYRVLPPDGVSLTGRSIEIRMIDHQYRAMFLGASVALEKIESSRRVKVAG